MRDERFVIGRAEDSDFRPAYGFCFSSRTQRSTKPELSQRMLGPHCNWQSGFSGVFRGGSLPIVGSLTKS
jgi:hypothetical protein